MIYRLGYKLAITTEQRSHFSRLNLQP